MSKLTPEEILKKQIIKDRDSIPDWNKSDYARAFVNNNVQNTAISAMMAFGQQQVNEKEELLLKAQQILTDYLVGKSSIRLFKADARIFLHELKICMKPSELPIENCWYPGCNYQALFDHMSKEHGLILTVGEMTDIINIFKKMDN